jgi:hypothetical protein
LNVSAFTKSSSARSRHSLASDRSLWSGIVSPHCANSLAEASNH